jgi:hypothetical protein
MKKYVSLAVLALMASSGLAMAQGFGGRGGGVEIEEDDDRGGRGGRAGRDGIAVGEPRPDRGGRDWDRGRGRETVIIRTLPLQYRFVEERGRRCRIVITRRQRANGTIVSTERREC